MCLTSISIQSINFLIDFLLREITNTAIISNTSATDSVTATYDMYVENSRAGLLKRSGLDVKVVAPSQTLTLYSVSEL